MAHLAFRNQLVYIPVIKRSGTDPIRLRPLYTNFFSVCQDSGSCLQATVDVDEEGVVFLLYYVYHWKKCRHFLELQLKHLVIITENGFFVYIFYTVPSKPLYPRPTSHQQIYFHNKFTYGKLIQYYVHKAITDILFYSVSEKPLTNNVMCISHNKTK